MPDAGEDHGQAAVVGRLDDLLVPDGATGLDCAGGAGFGGGDQPIGKGKQGLARDDGSPEIEPGLACLPDRDALAVNAGHLPGAYPEGAFAAAVDDGIGLYVLADFPAEEHAGPLLRGGLAFGYDLEFAGIAQDLIPILQEHATDDRAYLRNESGPMPSFATIRRRFFFLPKIASA